MQMICKLHGYSRSIISDRDPIFINKFWQALFQLTGAKLKMSTAYDRQTKGQTEDLNRYPQQYLCIFHVSPRIGLNTYTGLSGVIIPLRSTLMR